ncbi:hypothetical protein SLS55_010292 [Diplodia seriata]|uniref:RNase H type-1 domain-containing protein n=1 Tax=Diplodia seriata TaxID=420778 RepID=A0ABR3BY48_9PEZI
MSSVVDPARVAFLLAQHDRYQFCGHIKTPPPHQDPASQQNRSIALQTAAQEYFRADAHERAVFWTDASTRCTRNHSNQPEGGAEGCPTAISVVWRQLLPNGEDEWADDTRLHDQQLSCTILRAEMTAILLALQYGYWAVYSGGKRVVSIYSDCLRAIDTIRFYRATFTTVADGLYNWGRDLIEQIIAITNAIRNLGGEVELQWIPRGGILGNRIADYLARREALGPLPNTLVFREDDTRQTDAVEISQILTMREHVREELRQLYSTS